MIRRETAGWQKLIEDGLMFQVKQSEYDVWPYLIDEKLDEKIDEDAQCSSTEDKYCSYLMLHHISSRFCSTHHTIHIERDQIYWIREDKHISEFGDPE